MKTLKNLILERLKLNKDTKIIGDIPTKFSDNIDFTQEEINIIQRYIQQMNVKPIILTNYRVSDDKKELENYKGVIFMYYDYDWDKRRPTNYIVLDKKDWGQVKMIHITMNNKFSYEVIRVSSYNIEDICKKLIDYLQHSMFYEYVKK